MKKLLAITLSVLCAFSCFAFSSSAAGEGGLIGEISSDFFERLFGVEIEEDTSIGYGVIYNIDPLDGVSVVYKPSPSISFENPGTYTITEDTPLAIDDEFLCWKDSKGKRYDAGDKIYVDGTITLYAVWIEKQDNDVRVARIIKTTVEALRRIVGKFLGFYRIVVEFNENYVPKDPNAPKYYDLLLNGIYYVDDNFTEHAGNERATFYIDTYTIRKETGLKRIDTVNPDAMKTGATAYLCTGWDEVYERPENISETYTLSYRFAEIYGPEGEDVLIVDTVLPDGKDIVSEYFNEALKDKEDIKNVYLVVTVNDSVYSSYTPDNGLAYDECCNPISCVFTLSK